MDWITQNARTVQEATDSVLRLLGVDAEDAQIEVLEEGKTGLFGRIKTEARVRGRIKRAAPPAREERRGGRSNNRNQRGDNRNRSNRGSNDQNQRSQRGGRKNQNNRPNRDNRQRQEAPKAAAPEKAVEETTKTTESRENDNKNERNENRNNENQRQNRNSRNYRRRMTPQEMAEREEMDIQEQRDTLRGFVEGVVAFFDDSAKVSLVEEENNLEAQVTGEDLGRLVGRKAHTLNALEELSRTAMQRAADGRRYHRIKVDVDKYRARRSEALIKFTTEMAERVVSTGSAVRMDPMGAADRKLVHNAVAEVEGAETVSAGRDPRRYIIISPVETSEESRDEEE